MKSLGGLDASFLYMETPQTPMHVAGLSIVELPKGFHGNFYEVYKRHLAARLHLFPVLMKKIIPVPWDIDHPIWIDDDALDLDYHIRESRLPKPGTMEQLEDLVGRLHSNFLDRSRPLWEFYVIDGLADGHIAVYTKIHHAAVDGGAGMALTNMMYDLTPTARQVPPPPPAAKQELPDALALIGGAYKNMLSQQVSALQKIPDVLKAIASVAMPVVGNVVRIPTRGLPNLVAPKTILNATITSQRSFTARSLPLADAKAIAKETGTKLNDVVMATCAGALRRYLIEKHALPKEPLVAFVPVSLRDPGNTEANNQVSGMMCSLATDIRDPRERLLAIQESSRQAKDLSGKVRDAQPRDFSIFGAPFVMHEAMELYGRSHLADRLPPPANVVISNVPGPQTPLYVAGAKVLTLYPVSIPAHGMALNLTVQSYCGSLDFGLTACRKTVPDLRKLAGYLDESLQELYDTVFPAAAHAAKAPVHAAASRKRASPPAGARGRAAGKSGVRKDTPSTARAAKAHSAPEASATPASAKRSPASRAAKTTGKTARA
ncbi:MAG TPA: wax ester/triacylglycerol synthase family O-acyltransferase [Caldimonas sp.]|nr:wax ester/triacylglycerol synthase family O-acyltransferase [Caldimonas sp.]